MTECTCHDLFGPLLGFFVIVVSAVLICEFDMMTCVMQDVMAAPESLCSVS